MNKFFALYTILCCMFCTIIITGNLIFQKFIQFTFLGYNFEISAGVLFYPISFLISDLVTEFYGIPYAKLMIRAAILCSLVVLFIVIISEKLPATPWSVINDTTFYKVFNMYGVATLASLIANYIGQSVDIRVYDYFKNLTKNNHLWLRNNISTFCGQFIDTIIVVTILLSFNIIPPNQSIPVILSSLSFKILAAICDTPFCYLGYFLIKKLLNKQ